MGKAVNISGWPTMKGKCPTCPFNQDEQGRDAAPAIADRVRRQCLTEASQICHHPRLRGKKEDHLCRGARDVQLAFFHRIGLLDTPTDEAWENKTQEIVLETYRQQ
ncbi:MAG: hypothetical protein U1E09_00400 [Methylococcales bacterium]|nr:hypothetical protein [Methylobacter sp.]MDZ4154984.1 hypothetical protein [Methylococcales bacterium]MDP2097504.1 hypothetical protein [Methylobacter sp.]MDP2426695.1 hypothetical protein [Methylobacter sp.]MDP3055362.1 hypothetical protein [Methylobacter sp.]